MAPVLNFLTSSRTPIAAMATAQAVSPTAPTFWPRYRSRRLRR